MKLPRRLQILSAALLLSAASQLAAQTPGIPTTITIDQAVQIALDRNLEVERARIGVESAGARLTSAFGAFLPTVNLSAGYTKPLTSGDVVIQGTKIPGNQPDNILSANASTSVVLFNGFANSANYSAAQSSYDATLETLNKTRADIAFQARSTFLNALRAEQIMDVRKNDLEVAREQLARLKGLVEGGVGLMTSVYSQEAEVANGELALEQAITDATIARNTLKQLLNVSPLTELQLSNAGVAATIDTNEIARNRAAFRNVGELAKQQLEQRREVEAARLNIDAARFLVDASKGSYYPSLSATLGYSWQKVPEYSSDNADVSLNLSYSPFDGFRTSESVQLAQAQLKQSELELQQLQVQLNAELQQAIARLDGAERQLLAANKSVQASRQSRIAADERYKVGVGNYSDYLLANAQYLNAQINNVNAVFNYRLALYEVRYQLGQE
ncbi:MAG: TolC family protein [Chlorobi bacterium]|nr:TolC family protein [Chlorobiota bacterium]MBX7217684.1 TolC family protein [Candidatus Kapabacteria bacterium]